MKIKREGEGRQKGRETERKGEGKKGRGKDTKGTRERKRRIMYRKIKKKNEDVYQVRKGRVCVWGGGGGSMADFFVTTSSSIINLKQSILL